jgi:uncharacterized protein YciI
MRAALLVLLAFSAGSVRAAEPPDARAVYIERRGLIEADARCTLFTPNLRAALQSSAGQARGTLLRAGWSRAQIGEIDVSVAAIAQARSCADARTLSAAADARAAFALWTRANDMAFRGWARTWQARRVAASDGWRLRQEINALARFGVRARDGVERLVLVVTPASGAAPTAARLRMRNVARTDAPEIGLQLLMTSGLEAGAPTPAAAPLSFNAARTIVAARDGARGEIEFAFPDAAFARFNALDPRESVEVIVSENGRNQRLLVEVGDIAAAHAFLAIGAN